MYTQLTDNAEALRLFLTEDIYLVKGETPNATVIEPITKVPEPTVEIAVKTEEKLIENLESETPPMVAEPKVEFEKTFDFKYKGKNQKGMLILVEDADNDLSTKEGVEVLTKLMTAIKVTGADVALINYAHYNGANYQHFYKALNCNIVLSFGVDAATLQTPPAEIHTLIQHGPSKLIYTQHLHILAADDAAKRKLWATLKTLL